MAERKYKVQKGDKPEELAKKWMAEQGITNPSDDQVDTYASQIVEAAKASKAYNDDKHANWLLIGKSFDIPVYSPPISTTEQRQPIPMGWSWRATDAPVTDSFEAADENILREQSNKYLDKWVAENYGKEYMPSEEDYNAFYAMMLDKNGRRTSGKFFTPALEKYQIPFQPIAPEGGMSVAPEIGAPANGGSVQAEDKTEVKTPIVGQKTEEVVVEQSQTPEAEAEGVVVEEPIVEQAKTSSTGLDWLDNAMRVAEQGTGNQGGQQ